MTATSGLLGPAVAFSAIVEAAAIRQMARENPDKEPVDTALSNLPGDNTTLENAMGVVGAAHDVVASPMSAMMQVLGMTSKEGDSRPFHEFVSEELIGLVGAESVRDFAKTNREAFEQAQQIIERRMSPEESEEMLRLLADADPTTKGKRRLIQLLKKKSELPPDFSEADWLEKASSPSYWVNTFPQQIGNLLVFIGLSRAGIKAGGLAGASTLTTLGSGAIEGGSHYSQAIAEGVEPKEAAKQAAQVAKVAGPLTGAFSGIAISRLGGLAPITGKAVGGAILSELPEETGQTLWGNLVSGKPLGENMTDTMLMSVAFGFFETGGVIKTGINARKFRSRIFDALEESDASAILPILEARGNYGNLSEGNKAIMKNVFSDAEGSTYSKTLKRWAEKLGVARESIEGKSTAAMERIIAGLRGKTGQPKIELDQPLASDEELAIAENIQAAIDAQPEAEAETTPTAAEPVVAEPVDSMENLAPSKMSFDQFKTLLNQSNKDFNRGIRDPSITPRFQSAIELQDGTVVVARDHPTAHTKAEDQGLFDAHGRFKSDGWIDTQSLEYVSKDDARTLESGGSLVSLHLAFQNNSKKVVEATPTLPVGTPPPDTGLETSTPPTLPIVEETSSEDLTQTYRDGTIEELKDRGTTAQLLKDAETLGVEGITRSMNKSQIANAIQEHVQPERVEQTDAESDAEELGILEAENANEVQGDEELDVTDIESEIEEGLAAPPSEVLAKTDKQLMAEKRPVLVQMAKDMGVETSKDGSGGTAGRKVSKTKAELIADMREVAEAALVDAEAVPAKREEIPENLKPTLRNINAHLPEGVELEREGSAFRFTDAQLFSAMVNVPRLGDLTVREWVQEYTDKKTEEGSIAQRSGVAGIQIVKAEPDLTVISFEQGIGDGEAGLEQKRPSSHSAEQIDAYNRGLEEGRRRAAEKAAVPVEREETLPAEPELLKDITNVFEGNMSATQFVEAVTDNRLMKEHRADLVDLADKLGLEVTEGATKPQIVKQLREEVPVRAKEAALETEIESQIEELPERDQNDDIDELGETPEAFRLVTNSPLVGGVLSDGKRLVDALEVGDTGRALELAESLLQTIGRTKAQAADFGLKIRDALNEQFGDGRTLARDTVEDDAETLTVGTEGEGTAHDLLRALGNMQWREASRLARQLTIEEIKGLDVAEVTDNALEERPANLEEDAPSDLDVMEELFGPGAASKAEFERHDTILEALDEMDRNNVPEDDPLRNRLMEELDESRASISAAAPSPMPNPEVEARIQGASTVREKVLNLRERAVELRDYMRKVFTREHEHLPRNDPRFAQLGLLLTQLAFSRTVINHQVFEDMTEVVEGLSQDDYFVFERVVLFRDIRNEITPPKIKGKFQKSRFITNPETGQGVFGMTKKEALAGIEQYEAELKKRPDVARAIEKREALWTVARENYLKTMKDIGINMEERFLNEDYFRHQVLVYANVKNSMGAGKKLRKPRGSSIHKGRTGTVKDWNTNYLEAEWEVLTQMSLNVRIAEVVKHVADTHDIMPEMKRQAKKDGVKVKDIKLREGYDWLDTSDGNVVFIAHSIAENLANKLMKNQLDQIGADEIKVRKVTAMGGRYQRMMVPIEVKETLDNLNNRGPVANPVLRGARDVVRTWKKFALTAPGRIARYSTRNMLGDSEATYVGNPIAFKKSREAASELARAMNVGAEVTLGLAADTDGVWSKDLKDWFARNGFGGMISVSELGDVNQLPGLKELRAEHGEDQRSLPDKMLSIPGQVWDGYFRKARLATDFREAILRFANYKSFLEQLQSEAGLKTYAASVPEVIDALAAPEGASAAEVLEAQKDQAAMLANQLMGAYDQVSVGGRFIRDGGIVPFWPFTETNFRRFKQMASNNMREGNIASFMGRKAAGLSMKLGYKAWRLGIFYAKAQMVPVILHVFNRLFAADEDDQLPEEIRRRPHLVFPGFIPDFVEDLIAEHLPAAMGTVDFIEGDRNRITYLSRFGVASEAMEWFGLDALNAHVMDFLNGRRSLADISDEMSTTSINKIAQSIPALQLGAIALGIETFPDITNVRGSRSRLLSLLRLSSIPFSESAYKWLTDLPVPPTSNLIRDNLGYNVDGREAAYHDIVGKRFAYENSVLQKSNDIRRYTDKQNALYHAKLAVKYGDKEAEQDYLKIYFNKHNGGTLRGMQQSMEMMSPLGRMKDVDTINFLQTLDSREVEDMIMAMRWYDEVVIGDGFGSIVAQNISWMGDATSANDMRLVLQDLAGQAMASLAMESVDALPEGAPTGKELTDDLEKIMTAVGGAPGLLQKGLTEKQLSMFEGASDRKKQKIIEEELLRHLINKEFDINLPFVSVN